MVSDYLDFCIILYNLVRVRYFSYKKDDDLVSSILSIYFGRCVFFFYWNFIKTLPKFLQLDYFLAKIWGRDLEVKYSLHFTKFTSLNCLHIFLENLLMLIFDSGLIANFCREEKPLELMNYRLKPLWVTKKKCQEKI